ncbi:MAG: HIT family protein [Candidatus Altiarchaeota archaeon]|nr:HIT family protein [Candidatus Altiarchaeota archaeon]
MDCIFCKIVTKDIPSKKIYENEGAYAFLDVSPLSDGHTLVIPKKHVVNAHEIDSNLWGYVSDALEFVTKKFYNEGVKNYNILQNNGKLAHQAVMHVHFHIIPKTEKSGLDIMWSPIK